MDARGLLGVGKLPECPGFEVVRPGDVRDGKPSVVLLVQNLAVVVARADAGVDAHACVEPEVVCEVDDRDVVGIDALIFPKVDAEEEPRDAGFEEEAVRDRRAPCHLGDMVRPVRVIRHCLGRVQSRVDARAVACRLLVVIEVDLVALGGLPGQADVVAAPGKTAVLRSARIGVVDVEQRCVVVLVEIVARLGQRARRAPGPVRGVEPEPVALDRPAHGRREVVDPLHLQHVGREAAAADLARHVLGLHAGAGVVGDVVAGVGVAPFTRHDVHLNAAGLALGRDAGRLEADLLDARLVDLEDAEAAACAGGARRPHAVDAPDHVAAAIAMDGDAAGVFAGAPAHILRPRVHRGAQHQRDVAAGRPADRQQVERVAREDRLRAHVRRVDDRGFAGYADRLLDGTDLHLGVDRGREAGRQLDPLALEGGEAGEPERNGVGARAQVDDPVHPVAVGDGRADLFNQRRAGGFDGHTGQHAARCVANGTGDRAADRRLRSRRRGQEDETPHRNQNRPDVHTDLLARRVPERDDTADDAAKCRAAPREI